MYPYVKCPTCGCLLGHIYRLFQAMRVIKNQSDDEDKNLMDIFAILGLTNYCCKTRVMTARQFNDFLHE
jgi:DNA-directed RNA polymerase subunit N (RpoN/RPB10)